MKTMTLQISSGGYKKIVRMMHWMGFTNQNYFLRYCVLNTLKTKVSMAQRKLIRHEMQQLLKHGKRK